MTNKELEQRFIKFAEGLTKDQCHELFLIMNIVNMKTKEEIARVRRQVENEFIGAYRRHQSKKTSIFEDIADFFDWS